MSAKYLELDAEIERLQRRHAEYAAKLTEQVHGYNGGFKPLVVRTRNAIAKLERERINLLTEGTDTVDRKNLLLEEEVANAQAGDGLVPIAYAITRITNETSAVIYPRACLLPLEVAALPHVRKRWVHPSQVNAAIQPKVEKLEPKAEMPNPKVEIIADADPVASYRLTRNRLAEQMGGNYAKADDLMARDREGSRLFELATRVGGDRDTVSKNLPGRRIPPRL